MKTILKFILSIIFFIPLTQLYSDSMYELVYSEWSEEYPNDVDETRIISEDRYLWFKDIYNDETMLMDHIITEEYYSFLEGYTKIDESNALGHIVFGLFPNFKPSDVYTYGKKRVKDYKIVSKSLENQVFEARKYADELWTKVKGGK